MIPDEPSVEDEVRAAEDALGIAMASHDVGALARLLHDDVVYTDPMGNVGGKEADLHAHRTRQFTIHELTVRELVIELVHGSVAVTRSLVDIVGEPVSGTLRYTRVWTNEVGHWQVRVAHIGIVPGG